MNKLFKKTKPNKNNKQTKTRKTLRRSQRLSKGFLQQPFRVPFQFSPVALPLSHKGPVLFRRAHKQDRNLKHQEQINTKTQVRTHR